MTQGSDPARLVVVCGLPGTGKTTVATEVAERVGGRLLRTDVVRKELVSDPAYTDAETERVYRELLDRAGRTLAGGGSAVVDGTFRTADLRGRARETAAAAGADFRLVKVECEEAVVRERIAAREDDESDADFAVHRLLREEFDPVADAGLVVDNSGDRETTRRRVHERF
ncbi:AAA family ATPase [Candidatus Halobonum tyrrellensis]|uniref:Kinase n=1 Tax=Candidatus Halobonum tyrrellensis G22 TaxID=1324957 RepID=V4HFE6_9EURY|nr:AAA family ATPase [Candidatus Halobonum tyrrellensis]ESP88793.1 kinase [Candidatus Halobonum tyrrellensis G22]